MRDSESMAAADYVLGVLELSERRDLERRLPSDPDLQGQVSAWEARLSSIAEAVEPIEPSEVLWERISGALDRVESSTSGAERPQTVIPFRGPAARTRIPRPFAGALALMAASLAGFVIVRNMDGAGQEVPGSSLQAIAPTQLAPARQPTGVASASPCATGSGDGIQIASAVRDARPQDSISTAKSTADSSGAIVAGQAAPESRQKDGARSAPANTAANSDNVPAGAGAVTVAAASTGCK